MENDPLEMFPGSLDSPDNLYWKGVQKGFLCGVVVSASIAIVVLGIVYNVLRAAGKM